MKMHEFFIFECMHKTLFLIFGFFENA